MEQLDAAIDERDKEWEAMLEGVLDPNEPDDGADGGTGTRMWHAIVEHDARVRLKVKLDMWRDDMNWRMYNKVTQPDDEVTQPDESTPTDTSSESCDKHYRRRIPPNTMEIDGKRYYAVSATALHQKWLLDRRQLDSDGRMCDHYDR